MAEKINLSYDAWKEYLKTDKEMNSKWKSLIALGENVKKDLKENLESLPYSEALRRRKYLTAKNIFNAISTAKEKPDFSWFQKVIYNEEDGRHELVIQCMDPSSDYIFRKIKEERGVASMFGSSIDKYLQPVADKIWALKDALRVSVNPETTESDLSYEALKTEVDVDYPKAPEGWSGPIDPGFSGPSQVVSDDGDAKGGEDGVKNEKEIIIRDEKGNLMRSDGQYLIDFGEESG